MIRVYIEGRHLTWWFQNYVDSDQVVLTTNKSKAYVYTDIDMATQTAKRIGGCLDVR